MYYAFEDLWEEIRHSRPAVRARTTLLAYTLAATVPFVALVSTAAFLAGLQPHEIVGVTCYDFMVTSLFLFDVLREAAHDCFDEARDCGFVSFGRGIPVVDPAYPHVRLARLSFAIGGRDPRTRFSPSGK